MNRHTSLHDHGGSNNSVVTVHVISVVKEVKLLSAVAQPGFGGRVGSEGVGYGCLIVGSSGKAQRRVWGQSYQNPDICTRSAADNCGYAPHFYRLSSQNFESLQIPKTHNLG